MENPYRRLWVLAVALPAWMCCAGWAEAADSVEMMFEVSVGNETLIGQPVCWSQQAIYLLGRDGRMWSFRPNDVTAFKKTAERFRPFSPSQVRGELLRQLGHDFEVSGTTHYMVAHARGERDVWANRFEELYRSFSRFFSVRGFQIDAPPFPLVGVVCRSRGEFARQAAADGVSAAGVLGYYCLESNRILLYDMGRVGDSRAWQETSAVIIHEATHQVAFNTGIHSRCNPPSLWVIEGLATMFEAPGVYDAANHPQVQQQINRGRLEAFRQLPLEKAEYWVRDLVASDRLFRANPGAAYAEAWALSFYLAQKYPRGYVEYLRKTPAAPPDGVDAAARRMEDFAGVFGSNWPLVAAQVQRFVATLP